MFDEPSLTEPSTKEDRYNFCVSRFEGNWYDDIAAACYDDEINEKYPDTDADKLVKDFCTTAHLEENLENAEKKKKLKQQFKKYRDWKW